MSSSLWNDDLDDEMGDPLKAPMYGDIHCIFYMCIHIQHTYSNHSSFWVTDKTSWKTKAVGSAHGMLKFDTLKLEGSRMPPPGDKHGGF